VSSETQFPNNDNNVLGIIPSAYLGTTDQTREGGFGYGFFLPSEVNWQDVTQEVDRFTGSAQLDWQPIEWLSARTIIGLDQVTRADIENLPREQLFFGATRPLGTRTVNTARVTNFTFDANVSANFQLTDMVTSRTTVGTQYFIDDFTRADAFGGHQTLLATFRAFRLAVSNAVIRADERFAMGTVKGKGHGNGTKSGD